MRSFRVLVICLGVAVALLVSAASAVVLYKERAAIMDRLGFAKAPRLEPDLRDTQRLWAKRLLEGGYILHFRHAERDKLLFIHLFDSLEVGALDARAEAIDAGETYYADIVCLNPHGKEQARGMADVLKVVGFPTGPVISSPSCRARQTGEMAFGRLDEISNALYYAQQFFEDRQAQMEAIRSLLQRIPIEPGKNTITTGHSGLIASSDLANKDSAPSVDETGFHVISRQEDGTLRYEYSFKSFVVFTNALIEAR